MNPIKMIAWIILIVAMVSGCGGSEFGKPAVPISGTIVFYSGHGKYSDIYLLDAQGTHKLTGGGSALWANPAWSPDGTQIAFITDKNQLAIYLRDGSGGATLTPEVDDVSLWPHDPAWLPDGNIAIFVHNKVAVMSPEGAGVRLLTPTNPKNWQKPGFVGFNGDYAWSPDRTQLVFDCSMYASRPEVCLFDVESNRSWTYFYPLDPFTVLAWSPDGNKILLVLYTTPTPNKPSVYKGLYVFDVNRQHLQALAQPEGKVQDAAWSPDGTQIVYQAYTPESVSEDGEPFGLWVMNADGSGAQRLLSKGIGLHPDWTAH
jgi:Tol biopolymer transport system component